MPAAATASVRRVAKCSLGDAERDMHRLGKEFRLRLGVRLSRVPLLNTVQTAVLFMSSWVKFFLEKNLWYFLCGLQEPDEQRCERQLGLYWERFRGISPNHPVFQRSSAGPLQDLSHPRPRGRRKECQENSSDDTFFSCCPWPWKPAIDNSGAFF